MQATIALLANAGIHNRVRKLSWDIHRAYQTGLDICRLPPHVSLKQPFDVSDLDLLAKYMDELAKSIEPFRVRLYPLDVIPVTLDDFETGILWLDVQETEFLRGLHNRVNQELQARFGNVSAAFDGPAYHFHMTVAIGNQPIETYRKIQSEFSDRRVNLAYTVRELVMFVYDDRYTMNAGYMTYHISRLEGSGTAEAARISI